MKCDKRVSIWAPSGQLPLTRDILFNCWSRDDNNCFLSSHLQAARLNISEAHLSVSGWPRSGTTGPAATINSESCNVKSNCRHQSYQLFVCWQSEISFLFIPSPPLMSPRLTHCSLVNVTFLEIAQSRSGSCKLSNQRFHHCVDLCFPMFYVSCDSSVVSGLTLWFVFQSFFTYCL